MSLSQPSGLSALQKRKLKQNEPTMDDVTGIPEAVATEADLSTMIEELASTDSGKGASCIGYEGGTTVQAQVAANTADIAALGGGGSTGFDAETAGAGGKMELYEATANGTNKVTMASPASLAADRTITVPDADVTLADIATNTAAIAAATTDTGVGAGNAGKLVELDGDGKLDGRNIGDDGTKLDGIEAAADVTDLANVTTALSVTAATAVAASAGAGDAGKLAKLDAGGKWDSTMIPATAPAAHAASHTDGSDDIQDATPAQKGLMTSTYASEVTANTAALAAADSTELGLQYHIKVSTPGGATANTDKALPAGTWEMVWAHGISKGSGTGGDTVQIQKDTGGNLSAAVSIAFHTPNQIIYFSPDLTPGATLIGGTDALRVAEVDGGGNDSPAVDIHIMLRKVA